MLLFDPITMSLKLDDILRSNSTNGVLSIIQIGNNASSEKYISIKKRVGEKLGIKTWVYHFTDSLDINSLKSQIWEIANREDVTGVIVQLPLPSNVPADILDLIPLEKDVDLLSKTSQGYLYNNILDHGSPITRATEYVLDTNKFEYENSNVLIVGNGFLVGKPLAHILKNKGCNVTVTDNYTTELAINKNLIILSAGVPNLINGEDMSPNTTVIDFGSTVIDGKTYGDLNMNSKLDHLGLIVPSPKGMGPIVVRFLFLNHLKKYSLN
jgi:methylenetetrahydrofolate dehydrogenase (NADP+)/methenyltetrahydrofolate cyclohydrolase